MLIICLTTLPGVVFAQALPDKNDILEKMSLTNMYFMVKWPDAGKKITTDRTRVSNIWTRAVYYEGLMALYGIDPRPEYYDYAVRWGDFHSWNLRNGYTYTRNADNQCAGQTYIDLYQIEPRQPGRILLIKASIDSMMNTEKIDDWDWIDAIQMAMPVFAKLGVVYNDHAYYDRMHEMYICTRNTIGGGLFNEKDGLWWRDADFVPPYTEPNGEDCYWSRGNGWVFAALARVMDIIPEDVSYRKQYESDFKEMAEALLKIQREDGFWNVSLHDPDHFGGKETTGTALFTYGMAWGINNGILSEKKYKPVVIKAWNAMVNEAVHPNGFLGYVQGTGKEPAAGQPVGYDRIPDFEDYGLGCFLLAGSEMFRLE